MKNLFLLALLIVSTLGASTSVQDQINALLQTGTKASDAIQTVLDLLRDLKQENFDAQLAADQKNETDEYIGQKTIAKFTEVQHLNNKLYAQSVENRERFENELRDTKNYLAWNEARVEELENLIWQRVAHQCYSNQLFIRTLRFAQLSQQVITDLKTEIQSYLITGLTEVARAQEKSIAEKLKSNVDLFNNEEIKAFVQLAEGEQQEIEDADLTQRKGTLGEKILQVLEEQFHTIQEHADTLEEAEIFTSLSLVEWIDSVRAEIEFLHAEYERRQLYADKLAIQIQAALAQQAKSLQIVKESQNALDQATADLEAKRQAYAEAKAKRDEENIVLDEVIQIFKEQVTGWSGR